MWSKSANEDDTRSKCKASLQWRCVQPLAKKCGQAKRTLQVRWGMSAGIKNIKKNTQLTFVDGSDQDGERWNARKKGPGDHKQFLESKHVPRS